MEPIASVRNDGANIPNNELYQTIDMDRKREEIWRSRTKNTPEQKKMQVKVTQRHHKNARFHWYSSVN